MSVQSDISLALAGLIDFTAVPVTYRRGEDSVTINATVGKTVFKIGGDFAFEYVESRDYLIKAADLIVNGTQIEPQRGDAIEETSNGITYQYEVLAPNDEPEWRYCDPFRQLIRVHTKFITNE